MSLPLIDDLRLLQNRWKTILDPIVNNSILKGLELSNISLVAATPLDIPTTLGRKQQGWFVTDINSNATVWRTQPFNAEILTLEASANTTVSIWVF